MPLRQLGVTLLEMMLVIGLSMSVLLVQFYSKQADLEQDRARQVGGLLHQYERAVSTLLVNNPNLASGVRDGSAWLKNSACGGSFAVGKEYLPCDFPIATEADPIKFGQLALSTLIAKIGTAPNQKIIATTTTSPFTVQNGTAKAVRSDLSGISALTAAASVAMGNHSSSSDESVSLTGGLIQISYKSSPVDATIVMVASTAATQDVWLRTDGSNSMHAALKFDAPNEADREIQGASRIQNLAAQVLKIGSDSAIAPVSGAAVVIDTNTESIGTMRLRNAMTVDNGASVTGNLGASVSVSAGQNVAAGANISAGQGIMAGQSITATGNVTAGAAVLGQIFYDTNNTGYYADPSNTSILTNVKSVSINNLSKIYSAGRVRTGEYFSIGAIAIEGAGCAPNGLFARAANGATLSCKSGTWSSGGIQGTYSGVGSFMGSISLSSSSRAQLIQVYGGSNGGCDAWDGINRYQLTGYVNGSAVVSVHDASALYSKTGTIAFMVPPNTAYAITSYPYNCNPGIFTVYAFNL